MPSSTDSWTPTVSLPTHLLHRAVPRLASHFLLQFIDVELYIFNVYPTFLILVISTQIYVMCHVRQLTTAPCGLVVPVHKDLPWPHLTS